FPEGPTRRSLKPAPSGESLRGMNIQRLSIGLAIALSVAACKKKDSTDNAAPKPADNPSTAPKPAEPVKPAEPPKAEVKPMTGPELAEQYKKCSQFLNDKKNDDFMKECVADDYKSHEGGMEMKADQ